MSQLLALPAPDDITLAESIAYVKRQAWWKAFGPGAELVFLYKSDGAPVAGFIKLGTLRALINAGEVSMTVTDGSGGVLEGV